MSGITNISRSGFSTETDKFFTEPSPSVIPQSFKPLFWDLPGTSEQGSTLVKTAYEFLQGGSNLSLEQLQAVFKKEFSQSPVSEPIPRSTEPAPAILSYEEIEELRKKKNSLGQKLYRMRQGYKQIDPKLQSKYDQLKNDYNAIPQEQRAREMQLNQEKIKNKKQNQPENTLQGFTKKRQSLTQNIRRAKKRLETTKNTKRREKLLQDIEEFEKEKAKVQQSRKDLKQANAVRDFQNRITQASTDTPRTQTKKRGRKSAAKTSAKKPKPALKPTSSSTKRQKDPEPSTSSLPRVSRASVTPLSPLNPPSPLSKRLPPFITDCPPTPVISLEPPFAPIPDFVKMRSLNPLSREQSFPYQSIIDLNFGDNLFSKSTLEEPVPFPDFGQTLQEQQKALKEQQSSTPHLGVSLFPESTLGEPAPFK